MSKGTAGTELSKRTNDGDERQQTHESQGIPQSVGETGPPRLAGASAIAGTVAALAGCGPKHREGTAAAPRRSSHRQDDLPDQSAHRRPGIAAGLRLHALADPAAHDGKGDEVDQETVNELVDYAIEHGVNYFDTSPVYVQGLSERSTGIALSRHPRDKYFLATKLSNFSNYTRENSLAMYRRSLEELQTDYFDYYLLHSVGGGTGIPLVRARYFDNGMMDFLLREREAGRVRNLGWSFHGDVRVFDYMLSLDIPWDFVQIQMNYADWRHAQGRNVNAEYLYGELEKRNIPVVIMEPLLGGRLTRLNDHLVSRLKTRRPDQSVASWAFRFAGSFPGVLTALSGMTYMEHLQDNIRTYPPAGTMLRRGVRTARGDRPDDARISHHSVQRLPILHAVPLRNRHPGHPAALQPLHQRGEHSPQPAGWKLLQGAPGIPDRLRPQCAAPAAGQPLHRLRPMHAALSAEHRYPARTCTASTTSSNDSNRARYNLPTSDKVRRVCKSFSPWYESCRSIN